MRSSIHHIGYVSLAGLCLGGLLLGAVPAENKVRGRLYARAAGNEVKIAVEIRIEPGWHLYHGPTERDVSSDEGTWKPTVLTLGGEGIDWSRIRYPEPEMVEQRFAEDEPVTRIRQHRGKIVLYARGMAAREPKLGSIGAHISGLTCQDEGVCIPYEETLRVEGPGADYIFAAFPADLDAGGAAGPPDSAPPNEIPSPSGADHSLWLFLLSAVGCGLVTLLMPCTWPMIPITISYFTKQASKRDTRTLPLSLLYGAGIVLTFVLIGSAVGPLIINFSTHPVTSLIIGGFVALFALSLFGIVDLQPPRFLLSVVGKASSLRSYAGVFLMGATLSSSSFSSAACCSAEYRRRRAS